jgi:hypothetical protein
VRENCFGGSCRREFSEGGVLWGLIREDFRFVTAKAFPC